VSTATRPAPSRGQPAQLASAGHDDQGATAAGQQRPHLLGVAGVVEDEQDAPVGEDRTQQGAAGVDVGRHLVAGNAEAAQQDLERLRWTHRVARTESAQVQIELTVGEAVRDPMCPVHGEGRLADAAGTVQHRDHDRPLRQVAGGVVRPHQRVQCGEHVVAAGEALDVGRQLARDQTLGGRSRRRFVVHRPGWCAPQQIGVDALQLGSRIDSELPGDPGPDRLVALERLGLPAAPIEYDDQPGPHRLA
jgi:hypothetical protein